MKKTRAALAASWLAAAMVAIWPMPASAQLWSAITPNATGAMFALDRDDNVYVAGTTPTGGLVTKYSATGVQLWQRAIENPGDRQEASWVTVDPAGNAVVSGSFVDTSGNPSGLIVAKYSPSGVLLTQGMLYPVRGYASRAATDAAGNVYVLGSVWQANASGNTTQDIVTLKYAPNGLQEWLRTHGLDSTSADAPAALAVTATGNVIVTGGAAGQMLMLAYDVAGNQIWSKAIPASTAGLDVAIGSSGEFYVVGGSVSSGAGQNFLVVKHDANFNELWRRSYAVGQYARRVAVDSVGNVIVTGVTTGATSPYLNWMTIKLDPNGTLLWSRSYDQHVLTDEVPNAIRVGAGDTVYITGQGGPAPVPGDPGLPSTVTVSYLAGGQQIGSSTTSVSVPGIAVAQASNFNRLVLGRSPQAVLNYGVDFSMNILPTVVAAADRSTGPAPLVVGFSSAGTTDPDGFGGALRYWWDFGDGQISTDANPSHSYAAGSYVARLTVTDRNGGAATSAPMTITASAPPPAPTSLALALATVPGGSSTTATVRVSGSAGVIVALTSSDPRVASVPASVVVAAGATSATFTVSTARVKKDTLVTLQARANGVTVGTTLNVVRRK